ncbi:hypothetical protein AGLY_003468 [Aphis glycines]|uniref:HAT C-terminal dimerisation domain-containing protein n=1 Tax=Aphis glycines TaxID=307491 RepID=A0A6G0TZQ3_APHGL|nr:hypothetical protein AGLY_003468 [Aphis glycines]
MKKEAMVDEFVEKAIDKTQELSKTGVKSGGVSVLLFKVREIMCSCTCRYEGCSCTDERRRFRSGPPESSAARSKVSVSPKKIVFLPGESDPDRTIPRLRRHMKEIACVAPYRYNPVQCPRFILLASHFSQVLLTKSGKTRDIPNMVTSSELRCIEDICSLLRPIEQLTRELSTGKFIMSSKVMTIIFYTRNKIVKQDPTFAIAKNFKLNIIEELDYRFESLDQSTIQSIGTILDPKFKYMHFKSPLANSKAQDKLVQMMDKDTNFDDQIICSTETDIAVRESKNYDLWGLHRIFEQEHKNKRTHMTTSREELKSYLHQSVIGLNENLLDEWESTKTIYPKLYKLA